MSDKIGELQRSCLESAKQIRIVVNQLRKLLLYNQLDALYENIDILSNIKEDLLVVKSFLGYGRYNNLIEEFTLFCDTVNTRQAMVDNAISLSNLLEQLDSMLEKLSGLQEKTCVCCGEKVIYLPLSMYYEEEQKKRGVEAHEQETLNKDEYSCPCCLSSDRDRLIVSFLKWIGLDRGIPGESLLQIAPAKSIEHWINANCPSLTYHSTDLFMDGVTFRTDIQCMSNVADESYDYFICSHVLEHVQSDRKALKELRRILKNDGIGILLVPLDLDATEIDEEWGLSEDENWTRFGQGDHCRKYAKNKLIERMEEAGFFVKQLDKDFFGEEIFRECGLKDTSVLYILTKQDLNMEEFKALRSEKFVERQKNEPLVSVIMPSYNHEKYVGAAIESVLNQTYTNYEFIVGDDASTDGTVNEILKYEEKIDQIHLYESNTATKIVAFLEDFTKGKYIAMMHSDDLWKPEKLQMQVDYLENHPECAACFTGCSCFIDDVEEESHELFHMANMSREAWIRYLFDNGNCLAHPSVMIRRDIYIELTRTKGSNMFRQLPDYYMWLRLLQDYDIHVIEQKMTLFRMHVKGENRNTSAMTEENTYRTYIEDTYIWYNLIKNMRKENFLKVFKDRLINRNADSENEIMCEKFFVLLNKRARAALQYCYDICQLPGIMDMLEIDYNFKNTDIYKLAVSNI